RGRASPEGSHCEMNWVFPLLLERMLWLAAPVVVLDPGHGGAQLGAQAGDFFEKDFALELALLLKADLEQQGFEVHLTREGDIWVALQERVRRANEREPAVFVSLHANAMPHGRRQKSHGIETYFLAARASTEHARRVAAFENKALGEKPQHADMIEKILEDLRRTQFHTESSRLAHVVHEALIRTSGARDRGVQQALFWVLAGLNAPAILVEFGFVSHEGELKRLKDVNYQRLLSKAVTQGIMKFLQRENVSQQ
ncbi:MAG: N-acetylmuramoyl-L-alanine amidase, partial [Proteobacteria bacterium]|nr:N-acetylmuramoyl-L-alanine amidase [Pseudomonadota bacterium]